MKKLFIFTLLFSLISLVWLSTTPISVFAGYCGDGVCGAGENGDNCPADCVGTCNQWQTCPDEHICPDGKTKVAYRCCPNCSSPDICVDIDTCPDGNRKCDGPGDCTDNPYCPGANSCPFIDCIDGNCVSDCVPCDDGGTHKECRNGGCVTVGGTGADECTANRQCNRCDNGVCQPRNSRVTNSDRWCDPGDDEQCNQCQSGVCQPKNNRVVDEIRRCNPGANRQCRRCNASLGQCEWRDRKVSDPSRWCPSNRACRSCMGGTYFCIYWDYRQSDTCDTDVDCGWVPPTPTPTPIPTATPTPVPTPTPVTPTPTPTPTLAPACPVCPGAVGLNDILRGDGRYNKFVQWLDVANEEGYRIYRCTGVGCTPSSLVTTLGPNVTSYTDTNGGIGFAPGTTLVYEVRPYRTGCAVLNCTDYQNDIPVAPTPTPTTPPFATPTPTPTLAPACPVCPGAVGLNDILRGDGRYDKWVQWVDVANEEGYRIYRCNWVGCNPRIETLVTIVGANVTSYRDNNGGIGFAPGATLFYEVVPVRTGCSIPDCPNYRNDIPAAATPTPTPTPTPEMGTVFGYIFVDLNKNRIKDGEENCFDGQAWIWVDSVKQPIFTSTLGCNTYSYPVQKGMSHSIWIYPIPSGYISTGWSGTDATGNIAGPGASATFTESEINFGFTSEADPWFQTRGGDVHAQGTFDDPIPSTAGDGPYFSLTGDGGYPGVVSYGGSLGPDPFGEGSASQDPYGWLANSTAKETSYAYFEALITRVASPETIYPSKITRIADLQPLDGFYKVGEDGNLTLPNGPSVWNINGPDQKVVVLVPGNLIIQSRRIGLADKNNFLAFIVQGNIIIDPNVQNTGGPALEGVYIADGTISTGATDNDFTGEGMFIAGSFNFQRDREADSATTPAERFIYRPDLWMNAPKEIWGTPFTWQELAP